VLDMELKPLLCTLSRQPSPTSPTGASAGRTPEHHRTYPEVGPDQHVLEEHDQSAGGLGAVRVVEPRQPIPRGPAIAPTHAPSREDTDATHRPRAGGPHLPAQ
jgi:hypothetical protein